MNLNPGIATPRFDKQQRVVQELRKKRLEVQSRNVNIIGILDSGGSRARFWNLQNWISTICWDFLRRFLPSKSSKTCLLKSTMPKMPKRLKRLRSQFSSRRKRPECDHEGLFYHHGQGKRGWAAVVPPGGLQLNPPPHRRWRRVLNSKSKSWPSIFKPKLLSFKSLGLDLRITPSLSLPRAPHIPPGRPQDVPQNWFSHFFLNFFAFQNAVQK